MRTDDDSARLIEEDLAGKFSGRKVSISITDSVQIPGCIEVRAKVDEVTACITMERRAAIDHIPMRAVIDELVYQVNKLL